jgi:hypothetical protein
VFRNLLDLFLKRDRLNAARRPQRCQTRQPADRFRPSLLPLEDRTVPAVLDLTGGVTSGTLNGGVFQLLNQQPAGSGVIDSFVRIDSHGNSTTEQGYNTSGRNQGSPKLNFDENSSPTFTHDLQFQDVPRVKIGNTWYREFRLDVNEPNNPSAIPVSLNKFKVFTSSTGSILASGPNLLPALGTLRWDMDGNTASAGSTSGPDGDSAAPSPGGNWVALNDVNHGSGQADMRVLVPESAFGNAKATDFVYLFSRFGDTAAMTGGYEEWYVGPVKNETPVNVVTRIDQNIPGGEIQNVSVVPLGSTVHDHAFVTDPTGAQVTTGSVTFSFWVHPVDFTGDPCSGDPTFTYTDTNGADGWSTPSSLQLHAGVYAYDARYNGDGSNAAGTANCEPLNVGRAALAMDTNIHDVNHVNITNTHVALGSVIHDKAFFNPAAPTSGEFVAAGTVKYTLYKDDGNGIYDGNDPVVSTSTETLNADSTIPESDNSPALHPGTYYYLTHYTSGPNAGGFNDYNNADGPVEVVTVDKAQLSITTAIHDAQHNVVANGSHVPLGSVMHDTATVSGQVPGFGIGPVSFTLNNTPVANGAAEAGYTATSVPTAALHAGGYAYQAAVAGNDDYVGATSDPEPFTVDKAQLFITTDIHNAAHQVITGPVPFHSNVHDTATVTGGVAGFPIPGVTFTLNGSPVATDPNGEAGVTARSVDSGPLTNGSYVYNATVASSGDYIGATSADEPLTVNPNLNRTQGYWKTHGTNAPGGQQNMWPVSSISIGGVVYTEDEAIAIMNLSTNGNAISSLFQQLVAAKLNVLSGFSAFTAAEQAAADEADAAIAQATGGTKLLIVGTNTLNFLVDPASPLGQTMVNDTNILDAFNSSSGL